MRFVQAPPGTQALQRAIGLLKQFSTDRPNQTLGELGSALGLTKSTTHRLLGALESEGLIARDETGNKFHLGASLIALGSQALLTSDVRTAARSSLEVLARESGETSTLEVQLGNQMLVLDGVAGRHVISARLELTTCWPIHATSTGKCLLAYMKESVLQRFLHSTLTKLTSNTFTRPAQVREELKAIRARGYAVAREELVPDYVAVAAVFYDSEGDIEGALCVGGPESRFTPKRVRYLGQRVKAAAEKLSDKRRRGR